LAGEDANVLKAVSFTGGTASAASLPVPDDAKTIEEAVLTAKAADVAILALGEPTDWFEGEAGSRVAPRLHRESAKAASRLWSGPASP